ncbi:AAA family ATPase [Micromonospora arborensis]|uniref:AAA family ATPase n=1 Tax=Micromonospora arborensis TaxID=2116518 RepID=UPI003717E034
MRPLTLRLAGLRAYRAEQTIDFTDASLMAIVGPTGAGKTSLFEALFYALYGGCTWDHRSAVPLIADGTNTMVVDLTFRAHNRTWRVLRSTSRSGSPTAQHVLECLDDTAVRHDHKDQVNATIEDLIGLDAKAFLKAVILPQGKFQELLHTTGRPRTEILKSILGLDQLDIMQNRAREAYDRIHPQLATITGRRQLMFADPQAEANAATQRKQDSETRRTRLRDAKNTIAAAQRERQRLADQAQKIGDAGAALQRVHVADALDTYQRLLTADTTLGIESDRVAREIAAAEAAIASVRADFATAEANGTGQDAVNTAIATLEDAARQQPDLNAEKDHLHQRAEALATERTGLAGHREHAEGAATHAANADTAASTAKQHADEQTQHVEQCTTALAAVRKQIDRGRQADEAHAKADAAVVSAQAALTAAEKAASEAHAVLAQAEEDLETCRRASSAAHAASRSHAGDPCPICSHELPADFVAPTPDGLETATSKVKTAHTVVRQADKAVATATANLEHATSAQAAAEVDSETARKTQTDLIAELSRLLGTVDLDDPDEGILAAVRTAADTASTEAEKAAEASAVALKASTELAVALKLHERRLLEKSDELADAQRAYDKKATALSARLATLPVPFQTEGLPAIAAINTALTLAKQRRAALNDIRNDLERAAQHREGLGAQERTLQQRHLVEIERPSQALHTKIVTTCERAADLAELLNAQNLTECSGDDLQARAIWAREIQETAQLLQRLSETTRTELQTAAAAQYKVVQRALTESQADTSDDLDDLLGHAAADLTLATEHLAEAQRQIPIAAQLDTCISQAQPLTDGLKELCRLLADGKFPAFIVARRQHTLLDLASELLLGMTGHRFRFADDFRIIDGQTGQSRDLKTLSGGETFMASLALALAVVELASRSGGRIEALFLDEGFGALDPNALAGALDALAQQTRGGRLIAVISHVKAVAENIDRLLVVSKRPDGSVIHWATAAERDQLVTDTMTESMIA